MAETLQTQKRRQKINIAVQLKIVIFNTERFYKQGPLFYRRKAKLKLSVPNFGTFFY